jgi:hypothetical protein
MRQFFYSEDELSSLKTLKEYATQKENWATPQDRINSRRDVAKHALLIPTVFDDGTIRAFGDLLIIYTIDVVEKDHFLYRQYGCLAFHHLSVSVRIGDNESRLPVHNTIIEHFSKLLELPPPVFLGVSDPVPGTHYLAKKEEPLAN